jgi:hypothetical protein
MDEPEGGGFVSGEFLLRADGVLLRRYGWSSLNVASNQTTWRFHAWEPVSWWTGETSPAEAVRILKRHGYDLVQPSPVPIDKQSTRP